MAMNRYLKRLQQLRWTINRWIQIYKQTRPNHLPKANEDLTYIEDEISRCVCDIDTKYRYTRQELLEFNRLYTLYKHTDEYSSPTAYASEYSEVR